MADLENRIRITKFDGTDFSLWKDKIINALKASDCEDSIKEAFKLEGDEDVLKGLIKKDEKAKLILMSSKQDNILRKLPRKEVKQIWKALHEKYEDKNTQNIIFVRRRFLNMKQETNETIEDYEESSCARRLFLRFESSMNFVAFMNLCGLVAMSLVVLVWWLYFRFLALF
jgi:hypothetical protein